MKVGKKGSVDSVGKPSGEAAPKVVDNPAESRFELAMPQGEPAIAGYRKDGNVLIFNHTVVPPEYQGKGIAEKLISGALAIVRDRGQKFAATCSYVQAYVKRHPEVKDIQA
jgi:predicted GNAT family acetyltransferase